MAFLSKMYAIKSTNNSSWIVLLLVEQILLYSVLISRLSTLVDKVCYHFFNFLFRHVLYSKLSDSYNSFRQAVTKVKRVKK